MQKDFSTKPLIETYEPNSRMMKLIIELQVILPLERFQLDAITQYGACTTGASRDIPFAVAIENKEEISQVLKIAQKCNVPVYPISTGKNWGYGTGNPVQDGCILLDLSRLNKILDFNPELATVRVEPGVTQAQLFEFMQQNDFQFLVPSTGAGPHASLMGNLLERGYGITPHMDHFGALLSIEAILPTGELYQSAMADSNCSDLNQNFKWGLGPYLDGLFAQSNFGIVTECTIALMRKPEKIEAFIFTLRQDADLTLATEALRELSQSLPGILGGMNLMNSRRVLAMQSRYPKNQVADGEILSAGQLQDLRKEHAIDVWTGIGGLYGTIGVVRAAKEKIRRTLRPFAKQVKFVDSSTLKTLETTAKWCPDFLGGRELKILAKRVKLLLDVVSGVPTEAALPLAYWMSSQQYQPGQNRNIAQDGCGLIWYSPLVINQAEKVQQYVSFVESICARHGIEPLITLTTVSERCFDSTIPILFDRQNPEATKRAQACYRELLSEGKKKGFIPYRLGVDQMEDVTSDPQSVSWRRVAKIKQALDPNEILSPGRYCPSKRHEKRS
ncbi:MAG: FAD-binding oxidoreductase [Pseudobdellovibrionaceae bacterium]